MGVYRYVWYANRIEPSGGPLNIIELLEESGATEPFRDAVSRFLRDGQPNDRVSFNSHSPPVKVARTLMKALEEYPRLDIESIDLRASSGCEFFRGTLELRSGEGVKSVRFHWDCKWRAEQMGWRDYFGFPDQARAAREFGHDCFRSWDEEPQAAPKKIPAVEIHGAGEPMPA